MQIVTLNRLVTDLISTSGALVYGSRVLCHTLELPYRNNLFEISSIPVGDYRCSVSHSPRFGKCFRVHDVPGRSGILIHPGNNPHETKGCILPGLDCSSNVVLQSKLAMDRLFRALPDEFILVIKEKY